MNISVPMRCGWVLALAMTTFAAVATTPLSLTLEDSARHRQVPVDVYPPLGSNCSSSCPVLLFGTGYRGAVSAYSFLLAAIAEAGIFVVGIQHDLEQDPRMPNTGDVVRDRTPFWERGVDTVEFVTRTLSRRYPEQDWRRVILAGHSQGGDIAARLAARPDSQARALVTLDNRRVPLPVVEHLPVLSIRSADQLADPGVLPELAGLGVKLQ